MNRKSTKSKAKPTTKQRHYRKVYPLRGISCQINEEVIIDYVDGLAYARNAFGEQAALRLEINEH